ncbi:uncharacterized protein CC84DRAFT_1171799 [Paraphaeosphaeria sporulosa]|uniref:Uncharacterized protein n=1 Tax=Paraphaeosphaeria sporulosa TaxID=1460663 RepID=A0A177CQY8_9PLEO|nr:uncharacterized protein CC84DRAFT_1171799 [Paraphaeosphaeria sporulosa]OAG09187.1 hypothetical protein CC84DRAFT_1171799 [Paraphaeosphaeria sporulosa]
MAFLDGLIDLMVPLKAGRSSSRSHQDGGLHAAAVRFQQANGHLPRGSRPSPGFPAGFPNGAGPGGPPRAPVPQFGTQMRLMGNSRRLNGYETDQPEAFRQGGGRRGPGLPALNANHFAAVRGSEQSSRRDGSQGGRSNRGNSSGAISMRGRSSASRMGRSQGSRRCR